MTEINIEDDCEVKLLDWMGGDEAVVQAARVSTQGRLEVGSHVAEEHRGLIRYLMRNRHGSPFEHGAMKFFVKAPIFVFREFHRHRIGFSYNEMSGRYKVMPPNFYSPPTHRPMTQTGKPGAYELSADGPEQADRWARKSAGDRRIFAACWHEYQEQLDAGIPREMARTVLPLALMSEMYVTCNPRSLMSFLSLRVDDKNAAYPTKPLWEIDHLVAQQMEEAFSTHFRLTYGAFVQAGRVAP